MFRRKAYIKLTALFVVAFICLNAGGALCVAYCQNFDEAAEPEHCPLQKLSDHCDKAQVAQDSSAAYLGYHSPDCCPMTVSFFAGPIEKSSFSFDSAAKIVTASVAVTRSAFIPVRTQYAATFNYRGPPLDHRVDRIKHCIIRI
ncbi:MAG TPA: hypothetical protein VJL58_06220 [Pyrinomonadaceae bacterium]|nr:hypothetical protein [Pyrinomonadaceae bacterium]